METARWDGRREGLEEGMEKGKLESLKAVSSRLKAMGLDEETIAKITIMV